MLDIHANTVAFVYSSTGDKADSIAINIFALLELYHYYYCVHGAMGLRPR